MYAEKNNYVFGITINREIPKHLSWLRDELLMLDVRIMLKDNNE